MPILGRMKVIQPKIVVKKETLSPAAIISGFMPPIESTVSNAETKPNVEPKKPITKPKILMSDANLVIFFDQIGRAHV